MNRVGPRPRWSPTFRTEEGVETTVGTAERGFGPVDVLVNNAGVELKKLVEDTSLEEWNRILRTNLTSAFLMSRRVVPGMKERRRGAIVMNSSVGNFIAATRSSAYGASKAGMMALARGLALEGAPYGIRVNAVCPGVIDTPMNAAESGADRGSGGDAPLLVRGHTARAARDPARCRPVHPLPLVRRIELRDGVAAGYRRRPIDPVTYSLPLLEIHR